MEDTLHKKPDWKEKLQDKYKLVILNQESFKEVGSYAFKLINFYLISAIILLLFSSLIVALIVFTPLKRFIPGYGDMEINPKFIELTNQTAQLEKEVAALQVYIDGNKNRLLGAGMETLDQKTGDKLIENESALLLPEIALIQANKKEELTKKSSAFIGNLEFITPVKGTVSAHFDPEKKHYGVDILAPKNTAVKATADGFVISSDWTMNFGNTIGIQHPNNIVSFYKHNSVLLKEIGDRVSAGEAIAIIGDSGELSDGPHLHFEIWIDGQPVNPDVYLTNE